MAQLMNVMLLFQADLPGAPSPEFPGLRWSDYFRMLLVLGVILGLCYVVIRHLLPRLPGLNRGSHGPIQPVARYQLEPRRTLYIVRTGSQHLLISSSENGIQFLTELNAADIQASLRQADEPAAPPAAALPAPTLPELWRRFFRSRNSAP